METLQELLNKLDTFNVVKAPREQRDTLHLDNGMQVSYDVKTLSMNQNSIVFQAVLRVILDDSFPFTWGCSTEEDNRLLVNWFKRHQSKFWEEEHDIKMDKLGTLKRVLEA
jgi:hypothetical protein